MPSSSASTALRDRPFITATSLKEESQAPKPSPFLPQSSARAGAAARMAAAATNPRAFNSLPRSRALRHDNARRSGASTRFPRARQRRRTPVRIASRSRRRRLRPRPLLVRPNGLERAGDRQHAEVVKPAPDDLQPDRQALGIVTAIDRRRRLLRHVESDGETDVRKRMQRVAAGRWPFGWKGGHRRGWRENAIEPLRRRDRRLAHLRYPVEAAKHLDAGKPRRGFRPFPDERQHQSAPLGRQGADVAERARAPEPVESVQELLGQERRERLHRGARRLEILRGALDGGLDFRRRRRAAAGLQQQADAQAFELRGLDDPIKLLVLETRI